MNSVATNFIIAIQCLPDRIFILVGIFQAYQSLGNTFLMIAKINDSKQLTYTTSGKHTFWVILDVMHLADSITELEVEDKDKEVKINYALKANKCSQQLHAIAKPSEEDSKDDLRKVVTEDQVVGTWNTEIFGKILKPAWIMTGFVLVGAGDGETVHSSHSSKYAVNYSKSCKASRNITTNLSKDDYQANLLKKKKSQIRIILGQTTYPTSHQQQSCSEDTASDTQSTKKLWSRKEFQD
ncbi:hypothetical protein ACJIZ3_018700 [Penstemon smallii]|uniref:Uncharacterized protein n=1 Tax=Penstemon smallii TaxID=265156 RepID=A0ABD3SZN7_9LAMI